MDDTGKQNFEGRWRDSLGEASVAPPENVWAGIQQRLDNESMRKRVIFYQRLAAASILFAFLAGAFGLYWRDQNNTQLAATNALNEKTQEQLANQKATGTPNQEGRKNSSSGTEKLNSQPESLASKTEVSSSVTSFSSHPIDGPKTTAQVSSYETRGILTEQTSARPSDVQISSVIDQDIVNERETDRKGFYGMITQMIQGAPLFQIELRGGPKNVELVRKLPAMPSVFLNKDPKKKFGEKWWASAGASAGAYNPNYTNSAVVSPSSAYSVGSPASFSASAPSNYGTSYSVALTAAHRISKHWVVQSGMQYMARSIDYTSNYSSYSGSKMVVSIADYATLNSSQVTVSSPYQLESRSEYISIPLQAGYVLMDRKFGWMLNSGISSDIFIRNTLTDLSGQRDSYSESGGQASPYRSFVWSALASTELSYKMGHHYRLALVPGMRYSLNQVMKSDQVSQGNPIIWDVGFRFRYIFK